MQLASEDREDRKHFDVGEIFFLLTEDRKSPGTEMTSAWRYVN